MTNNYKCRYQRNVSSQIHLTNSSGHPLQKGADIMPMRLKETTMNP